MFAAPEQPRASVGQDPAPHSATVPDGAPAGTPSPAVGPRGQGTHTGEAQPTHGAAPSGPVPTGPVPTGPAPTGPAPTGPAPTGRVQHGFAQSDHTQSGPPQPGYPYPYAAPGHVYPQPQPPTSGWPRQRPRRTGPWMTAGVAVIALVAGALGGVAAERVADGTGVYRPVDANLPAASSSGADAPEDGSVAAIAAATLPSVVSLQVSGEDGVATGSGVIIREDGYILTNNHVVAGGADGGDVVVLLADGSELPATIVGRTSDYDLAVVKIDAEGLTPLVLGDSDKVVVGDSVVAVGAPLGLDGTVTTGIVSALNRPVTAGESTDTAFINAIQTDAAINPGNSGGPLVDMDGEVVGINSAIAQPPGALQATGSIGLGFAIGSNQARRTAEQLIEQGTATYPVIGVLLDDRYTGEGVQVLTEAEGDQQPVVPGGPADDAGIRAGDVILAIDGRPVTQSDELIVAIRAKAPGDAVTLTVRTGDEERDVRVVLDEQASE
nr:trypsin-like peptidase domain-containing protein [Sediminihabitans luteus]